MVWASERASSAKNSLWVARAVRRATVRRMSADLASADLAVAAGSSAGPATGELVQVIKAVLLVVTLPR